LLRSACKIQLTNQLPPIIVHHAVNVMTGQPARETILEAQVNAALAGHDLAPFEDAETVSGGYQATCRRCGQTVWVGDAGLIYSLLDDRCNAGQLAD